MKARNPRQSTKPIHFSERFEITGDDYNVMVKELIGTSPKTGKPYYRNRYHTTLGAALKTIMELEALRVDSPPLIVPRLREILNEAERKFAHIKPTDLPK